METIWTWLSDVDVLAIVAGLIAAGYSMVKKFEAVERWKLGRALSCLEAGVRESYEGYVRAIKTARADGKLTEAERDEAMRRALAIAKRYAREEGVDLLKYYAKAYLPVLIERIVKGRKSSLPLGLLPEWEPTSL